MSQPGKISKIDILELQCALESVVGLLKDRFQGLFPEFLIQEVWCWGHGGRICISKQVSCGNDAAGLGSTL